MICAHVLKQEESSKKVHHLHQTMGKENIKLDIKTEGSCCHSQKYGKWEKKALDIAGIRYLHGDTRRSGERRT